MFILQTSAGDVVINISGKRLGEEEKKGLIHTKSFLKEAVEWKY